MYPKKKDRDIRRELLNEKRAALVKVHETLEKEQQDIRDVIFNIDTEIQTVLTGLDTLEDFKYDTK